MKNLVIAVAVIILALAAWLFLGGSESSNYNVTYTAPSAEIISEKGTLFLYTVKGESNGGAALNLSFTKDAEYSLLNVAVDFDGDDAYSEDEWVVQNQVRLVEGGAGDLSPVDLPDGFVVGGELSAIAVFSNNDLSNGWLSGGDIERAQVMLAVSEYELNDILGLDVPGNGPGVYRGYADGFSANTPIAYASSHLPTVNVDSSLNIGDIRQGNMECAPTSITNNLQALTAQNGTRGDLPSAEQMIEQLKTDLKFGDEGKAGVLDKNYIEGKNAFMRRYNLPIITTEISNPSVEDIAEAIRSGAVVEMDLGFIDAANGNSTFGSHVVTLTGVSSDGSSATLRGRDSATPDGNESWQFFPSTDGQPTTQLHYPLWRSATVVSKIYIQRYVTIDEAVTAGVLPQGTVGSTYPVEMLVIDTNYYPKDQFVIGNNPKDACGAPHYHKHSTAFGLVTKVLPNIASKGDPAPNKCGFGKVSDVPVETVRLTWEQQQALAAALITP